jgi:hypothetical protein
MAQLFKIRMPDGKTYQPADWTAAEPLYSTIEIGVGAFPVLRGSAPRRSRTPTSRARVLASPRTRS